MPKYRLISSVSTHALKQHVPKQLFSYINLDSILDPVVDVAVFSTDKDDVIISRHIKKLADHVSGKHPLMVIGTTFTRDAAELLGTYAQYFFCKDCTAWSDESYESIKIDIATKRKP